MTDTPRLIEHAFPLRQASLDSVYEKNMRHGHISTLHIWPARRPLAAARAALLATLLPDPGTPHARQDMSERIGGTLTSRTERKRIGERVVDVRREETSGGVLRWGRENDPTLDDHRAAIREAFGGRPPRVLDPFAGGGAIPLEALRLGCEVTANDLNPVAWFILRTMLQDLRGVVGKKLPLPTFARANVELYSEYTRAGGAASSGRTRKKPHSAPGLFEGLESAEADGEADFTWHLRAWSQWVQEDALSTLSALYPRESGQDTVAYLWARTVACRNCRRRVPMLKTRWLAKRPGKRVLLEIHTPAETSNSFSFSVHPDVPVVGKNAAQRREHDKRIGLGTMSRSGVTCPGCGIITSTVDIRLEGRAGRLDQQLVAVVVDGMKGKEYRTAVDGEAHTRVELADQIRAVFDDLPFGVPTEPTPKGGTGASRAFSVDGYGLDTWDALYAPRQLLSLGTYVRSIRRAHQEMCRVGLPSEWRSALLAGLACAFDRMLDFNSAEVSWITSVEAVGHTFVRYALPITWDYSEPACVNYVRGGWRMSLDGVLKSVNTVLRAVSTSAPPATVSLSSATSLTADTKFDVIVTDPPYYDAIPYSDLMDFFHVWLRRMLTGLDPAYDVAFGAPLGPKWDSAREDGELIDDAARHAGDGALSKRAYEEGMFRAFRQAHDNLADDGRFVVVFAHKHPDAWETLVSAIIRAGFVVDASWPIQTEQAARMRAQSSAALSSSVWLVCRKRPAGARPGWDNRVLDEMRQKITLRLREYWDAGIRGPDFVWAATGPALEAYSNHPVVKMANEPGSMMGVAEFLRSVRRIVVDFVVGRVLSHGDAADVTGLDDVTTYYLLHRHDFGLSDAPIGPCILYAVSCGLSDASLADSYDLLSRTGGRAEEPEEAEEDADAEEGEAEDAGSGATVKLKPWHQRKRPSMGYNPAVDSARAKRAKDAPTLSPDFEPPVPRAREVPLIDQVHRLMHLWKSGDVSEVDAYLDSRALRKNALFHHLLQALIELADTGSDERSILESLSNHVVARGGTVESPQLEAGV